MPHHAAERARHRRSRPREICDGRTHHQGKYGDLRLVAHVAHFHWYLGEVASSPAVMSRYQYGARLHADAVDSEVGRPAKSANCGGLAVAWFIGQSTIIIVLAFLLGVLVGWMLWARRLRTLTVEIAAARIREVTNSGGSTGRLTWSATWRSAPPITDRDAQRAAISDALTSPHIPAPRVESVEIADGDAFDDLRYRNRRRGRRGHDLAPSTDDVMADDMDDELADTAHDDGDLLDRDLVAHDDALFDDTDPRWYEPDFRDPDRDPDLRDPDLEGHELHGHDLRGLERLRDLFANDQSGETSNPGHDADRDPDRTRARGAARRRRPPAPRTTEGETLPASQLDVAGADGAADAHATDAEAGEASAEASRDAGDDARTEDTADPSTTVDSGRQVPSGAVDGSTPRGVDDELALIEAVAARSAVDDFTLIAGIGIKSAAALIAAGIRTYDHLAHADEATIAAALRASGLRVASTVGTWAMQARVLANESTTGYPPHPRTPSSEGGDDATSRRNGHAHMPPVDSAGPPAPPGDRVNGSRGHWYLPPDALDPEDLARIEGIGPTFAGALISAGIRTFAHLAGTPESALRTAIERAGLTAPPSLLTWRAQARLLADGDEDGFAEMTARLIAERNAADDLQRIDGIGPQVSAALHAAGIRTFRSLATADHAKLRAAIGRAGMRSARNVGTWARLARLLADGDEEGFAKLNRRNGRDGRS
jgi:predicted flap endonuclease-1-like 5' DNA nuclease